MGEGIEKMRSSEGVEIELTHQNKLLFPRDGYTKGDLVDYYSRIASTMLPYMKGRPVSMVRYPDGIDGESFFQKDASDYFPKWLRRVTVKKKNGTVDHVVCEKQADLIYLANIACITPHIWLSREDRLDRPDRMILDLDPINSDFFLVREAALSLRDKLEELGLSPLPMLTGSRGMHVVAPLNKEAGFDEVREFAREVAALLVRENKDQYTLEASKEKRGEKLLIDTFRNSYGQTGVAPYAVRAKDGAPVAAPVTWEEVEGGRIGSQSLNISNIFERLERTGDPWKGIDDHQGSVSKASAKMKHLKPF